MQSASHNRREAQLLLAKAYFKSNELHNALDVLAACREENNSSGGAAGHGAPRRSRKSFKW